MSKIKVFVRTRPTDNYAKDSLFFREDSKVCISSAVHYNSEVCRDSLASNARVIIYLVPLLGHISGLAIAPLPVTMLSARPYLFVRLDELRCRTLSRALPKQPDNLY